MCRFNQTLHLTTMSRTNQSLIRTILIDTNHTTATPHHPPPTTHHDQDHSTNPPATGRSIVQVQHNEAKTKTNRGTPLEMAAVSEEPSPESVAESDEPFVMNHQDTNEVGGEDVLCILCGVCCGVMCVCCVMCALWGVSLDERRVLMLCETSSFVNNVVFVQSYLRFRSHKYEAF